MLKDSIKKESELKFPKIGEIIEGAIIGPGSYGVFIDLGAIGTGVIYKTELQRTGDRIKNFKPGNKISVKIIDMENEDGYLELSLGEAREEMSWQELNRKKESGETVRIKILKANKGGLIAEPLPSLSLQGFLPVSQLSSAHYPRVEGGDNTKIIRELQKLIGEILEVKILDLDPRQGKLIFSEKAKELQNLQEIINRFKVNDLIDGEISGITEFGLFIKFALPVDSTDDKKESPKQFEGLIHISEINQEKTKNLNEHFEIGEKVKARIVRVAENKIYLSLKGV